MSYTTNVKNPSAIREVSVEHVEGVNLFGGTSNTYYSTPDKRRIVTTIYACPRGMYAMLHTGRKVIGRVTRDRTIGATPMFATEQEVREHLASPAIAGFLSAMTGRVGERLPEGLTLYAPNVCPACGVGEKSTVQEGYGDRTTCSHCEYETFYSIGD